MEGIIQILILGLIIWVNIALSNRKKKKKGDSSEEQSPNRLEELRQRVIQIRGNNYWNQFREQIVPPNAPPYIEGEEEAEKPVQAVPQQEPEEKETQIKFEEHPPVEKKEKKQAKNLLTNLGKNDLQRGIILAEILSPCLAKRKKKQYI